MGIFVAITFGLRSASAYQAEARIHDCAMRLTEAQGRQLEVSKPPTCVPASLSQANWLALQEAGERELN